MRDGVNTESLSYIEALSSGTCWFEGLRRTVVSSVPSSPPPLYPFTKVGEEEGGTSTIRARAVLSILLCAVCIYVVFYGKSPSTNMTGVEGVCRDTGVGGTSAKLSSTQIPKLQ